MPTEIVTRIERCAESLLDAVVVTVERLLSQRGDVVASTVVEKAPCTNADAMTEIGVQKRPGVGKMKPRWRHP